MSCISGKITLVSVAISLSVNNVTEKGTATFTYDKQQTSNLSISQICEINKGNYIKVDKDVVWVTPDVWEQIMIQSNTYWEII